MKKRILSILLISTVLLAGCGGNTPSDSSETSSVAPPDVTDSSESEADPVGGEEPAATDTTSSSINTIASEPPEQDSGIVLKDPEYTKLKEMITFDGEFVNLADIGAEVKELKVSDINNGRDVTPINADDEMLYYMYSSDSGASLIEFNAETLERKSIMSKETTFDVIYADKDYIIYTDQVYNGSDDQPKDAVQYRIILRGDGTERDMPSAYNGGGIYRIGKSLFFNCNKRIYDNATDEIYTANVVYRYSPEPDYLTVSYDNGIVYGASDYGMSLGKNGSIYYCDPVTDPYVSGEYPFSAAAMFMAGEYPTYTVLWNSDALGDKYEVGYYPHYLVRKVLFRTQYKTVIYSTTVTKEKAAVSILHSGYDSNNYAAVIDAANKKAAVLGGLEDSSDIFSSGSYVYIFNDFEYPIVNSKRLIVINTANMGQ